ncbi:DUF6753 family protein [Crocosphaera chwakensis]|uniref:DUF6753 family protein n=1 Tax=Crocosphaera chwakensis TaxID=2546361 RepID=UPI002FC36E12
MRSLISTVAIRLTTFCSEGFAGTTVPPWVQGKLTGNYSTPLHDKLTHDQMDALNWAMSREGLCPKDY